MPAKRLSKAKPSTNSSSSGNNEAPAVSRKRTRSSSSSTSGKPSATTTNNAVVATAEAPLRSPSISVSSASNSAIAVPPPPPPVDVDAAVATPVRSKPTPRAMRQTTLAGGVPPAASAATATRKTSRSSGTAKEAMQDHARDLHDGDGEMCSGEVKPGAARAASARARTAPSLLRTPNAAPLLEEALMQHLRHALGMFYAQAVQCSIKLSVQADTAVRATQATAAAGDEEGPPSSANEAEVEGGVVEPDTESAAEEGASSSVSVNVHAALPCVQYFIIHECARVAQLVRSGQGRGLCVNTDPATSAFELLTFLLSMMNSTGGMSALLVLACPSCRVSGFMQANEDLLAHFLVLSRRVTSQSELLGLDREGLLSRLGLRDEGRGTTPESGTSASTAAVPIVDVMSCCPFGEAHAMLHLLCMSDFSVYSVRRAGAVQWGHVPITAHTFPAIAAEAVQVDRAMQLHVRLCRRQQLRFQNAEANPIGAQRQQRAPPTPRPALKALLATQHGGVTWAEALLHTLVPESAARLSHRNAGELQSRIRRVFAYTSGDVARGGYLIATFPFDAGVPLHRSANSFVSGAKQVHARTLFSLMRVGQHIAEAVRRGGRCACRDTSSESVSANSAVFLETHVAHMGMLRRYREESHLLVADSAVLGQSAAAVFDVDADVTPAQAQGNAVPATASGDSGEVDGAASTSFYSAGSMSRFNATMELTQSMAPSEVVEYAARATLEAAEALPPSQVPRPYIQAELKRHQLENVQWMWSKECEGYREFVSVPLYQVRLAGAAAPVVCQAAVVWYCAAANHLCVESVDSKNSAASAYQRAAARVHGGLLCDDVGLGKTLSVLTLCAYDRAARERGEADASGGATTRHEPAVGERKSWITTAAPSAMREGNWTYRPAVLHWALGAPTAPVAPHPVSPLPLPRTTLVVVPLSIAKQWIDEIRKFYPAASYLLFYGAKRTQYTAADMRRAEFVITTYETLSSHLRQEADGVQYWLGCAADAADDAICAAAASQGITGLLPGDVFEAVQGYAKEAVWPDAAPPTGAYWSEAQLDLGSVAADAGCPTAGGATSVQPPLREELSGASPTSCPWTMTRCPDGTTTSLRCRGLALSVRPSTLPPLEAVSARQAQHPARCYAVGAVSDAFADRVWAVLCEFFAHLDTSVAHQRCRFEARLFDPQRTRATLIVLVCVYEAVIAHCPSAEDRRELIRRILLPPLWHLLDQYWQLMKPHYDAVEAAAAAGRPALRLTDLCFRRIVLDESQKCGPTSLFHLLGGQRRWGVTGTVLNNNKTASLAPVMRFLGLYVAARTLEVQRSLQLSYWFDLNRMHPARRDEEEVEWRMASAFFRGLRGLWWRGQIATEPSDGFAPMRSCCLCGECTQVASYGAPCAADTRVPCELRMPLQIRRFAEGFNCTPNVLLEVLVFTTLRHERNQQLNRELRLPPVQHEVHPVPLSVDEMHLYDRVARVIMNVAARLHRLGLFSSRIGFALQWVQELCRLCLHPSRVGNQELLRGDVEAGILRGVRLGDDSEGGVNTSELDAMLAGSFVDASPQEALRWAQGIAAAALRSAVPEETAQTLAELAQVPPLLSPCGVCMDDMAAPTLLKCFHMFCKECVLGIIQASRSVSGSVNAKCPYCRDRKSLLEEKRVVKVDAEAAVPIEEDEIAVASPAAGDPVPEPHSTAEEVGVALNRIGDGSRARAFVELVEEIWRVQADDGVLVFSKYPAFLQLAHDAVLARGYAPLIVSGSSTMAQRQRAMSAILSSADGAADDAAAQRRRRRILFVTSRSANAGLNLTFANHVVFLEPNPNPAMELQAIGRVHRFGQLKQVVVHHLYAPHTIEEAIYRRSVHLRSDEASHQSSDAVAARGEAAQQQRSPQFGRVAPSEVLRLLEYPVPPR